MNDISHWGRMRARLFLGILLAVCAVGLHAAGQRSGVEGREGSGGDYPRALPENLPNYPWLETGEPGRPLPGVQARGLQEDLLLLVDDGAAPLAEALMARLEAEGYAETSLIRRVPHGELMGTLRRLVEELPRSRRSVGGRGILAIGSFPSQEGARDVAGLHRLPLARRAPVFLLGPGTPQGISLSPEELATLWFEAERWSQVDPEWPDRSVHRLHPTDEGLARLLRRSLGAPEESEAPAKEPGAEAAGLRVLEDTTGGIALREYMEARAAIATADGTGSEGSRNLLAVDGVLPSDASISRGHYPLSLEIALMVPAEVLESVPSALGFALFAGSYAGEEALRLGWVPEPPWRIDRAVLQALAETY